jgi:hypothetical protein
MIDSGQAEYALLVDAEGSRHTQEVTLSRLAHRTRRRPTSAPSSPR